MPAKRMLLSSMADAITNGIMWQTRAFHSQKPQSTPARERDSSSGLVLVLLVALCNRHACPRPSSALLCLACTAPRVLSTLHRTSKLYCRLDSRTKAHIRNKPDQSVCLGVLASLMLTTTTIAPSLSAIACLGLFALAFTFALINKRDIFSRYKTDEVTQHLLSSLFQNLASPSVSLISQFSQSIR